MRGAAYMLTNVADKKGTRPNCMSSLTVTISRSGRAIACNGKTTDRDGKVEIDTQTKTRSSRAMNRRRVISFALRVE
jgi:hypothetical protein